MSLVLSGFLDLQGPLDLDGSGGKVTVDALAVLVQGATGTAPAPVPLPPPPATPSDPGLGVKVVTSFNTLVKANGKPAVAGGTCMQGDVPSWPGTVQPSIGNPGVKAGGVALNVVGDIATIVATGAPAPLTGDGQ